jgi:hypothetical protein
MMAHAQENEKPPVIEDTTEYAPYRMMQGHRVAKSKFGELNIRPYTYFRYLNQLGTIKITLMVLEKPRKLTAGRISSYKK